MYINEIKQYIVKTSDYIFSRRLKPNEEIYQKVFNFIKEIKTNENIFQETNNFLNRTYGFNKYYLYSTFYNGSKLSEIELYEQDYKGKHYIIEYEGVSFVIWTLITGEIYRFFHTSGLFDSYTNQHLLEKKETIEEYKEEYIKQLKQSKRQCMNYYNKKIKNIKQEYKKKLKYYNDLLKIADKNKK